MLIAGSNDSGAQPTRATKKLMAVFELDDGRTRTVHFGSAGASDFTQHRDQARRARYLARHAAREDWENPMTAGALARWVFLCNTQCHILVTLGIRPYQYQ